MTDDVWVVTMPKLGETVTEGLVGNWLKQVGDEVALDDPLFEVSTDKVDSEIPSPYDGVITEILVPAGETVPVGTPLVKIGPPGSPVTVGGAGAAVGAAVGGAVGGAGHGVSPVVASGIAAAGGAAAVAGGGPGLADAASPAMGGSEGMAGEPPGVSVPTGEVHEVTMPKLGETVTEGTVGSWLKQVGEPVAFDDPLFEVSTDKVDSEIPSPYDGVLLVILVQAGETVPVGTPLARIGEPGAVGAAPPAGQPAGAGAPAGGAAAVTVQAPVRPVPATGGDGHGGVLLSPVVRRLAAEGGVDLASLTGTGAGGRIRREDVERAIASGGARAAAAP
ncbi:MAG TPA: biotin/lipoyl-containing protein, partial [Pseudonocardiaceae bacterium]